MDSLEKLKEFISDTDNSENVVKFSNIPEICRQEPCCLGVDEAGRGPVLGPMVYGIAFAPSSKPEVLKYLGCADSKTLTESARDEIFIKMLSDEKSIENVGWATEIISPVYISNCMLRRAKHSLNEVSMESAIGLIKKAADLGVNIVEVYVDTVGPPEKYQAKLKEIFPNYKITVAKKADSIYPIVSAASIAAKVTRDHTLKVWKFREGLVMDQSGFGSGYPGDPVTKRFISDQIDPIFGYPGLVRFSWSTADVALQKKAINVEFEEIDDEEKLNKKTMSISSFFSAKEESRRRRCKFFEERCLSSSDPFN